MIGKWETSHPPSKSAKSTKPSQLHLHNQKITKQILPETISRQGKDKKVIGKKTVVL